MLRFIDLTKCDPEEFDDNDFAFYDTVCDQFVMLAGEHKWTSREDFIAAYNLDEDEPRKKSVWPLDRFLSLIPEGNEEERMIDDRPTICEELLGKTKEPVSLFPVLIRRRTWFQKILDRLFE